MSEEKSVFATKKKGDIDEFLMDARKITAIEMLADGELTKTAISEKVGVSRQTLYSWMANEEFKAELDNRLANKKTFITKLVDGKLDFIMDKLFEIANDNSNRRVQAQVLLAMLDRSLGKATNKHELVVDDTQSFNTDRQEIEDVFDTIDVEAVADDETDER